MGTSWSNIDGAAGQDITICGNGELFMLSTDGALLHRAGVQTYSASAALTLTDAQRMGTEWENDMEGQAFTHVSCGKNGQTWLVAQDLSVHRCD